ncbi:enoyl-CoA hydratase/isomerase family protein [Profundibacter sp.]
MPLRYEKTGNIGVMTIDFPEKRNALNYAARLEMEEIATEIRDDPDVRSVVFSGGPGAFCSGGDISSFAKSTPVEMRDRLKQQHRVTRMFYDLEKPIIAAVDGPAYGVGFNLALLGDLILASPLAKFCQSYARVAIVPDGGGLYLLARMVGTQRAKAMFFLAETIGADEAHNLGIVHAVHSSETIMDEAMTLAEKLAAGPTRAFGLGKAMLNRGMDIDFASYLELEAVGEAYIMETEDHKAAVSAFMEKRKPEFKGR